MPAWLVTTTAATPAAFRRRMASADARQEPEAVGMVDVADLLGERPVAVDEDSGA